MDSETKVAGKPAGRKDVKIETKLSRLLAQAARLAVSAEVPPEAFANAAWQAYLRSSPGLAERLADMQFAAMLEELRSSGRLAKA